jgi:hypothetical protein
VQGVRLDGDGGRDLSRLRDSRMRLPTWLLVLLAWLALVYVVLLVEAVWAWWRE